MKKKKSKSVSDSILGLGLTTALTGGLIKLMGDNMFPGMGNVEQRMKLEEVTKSMAHGHIQGLLEHFEYRLDEQKREIQHLREKNEKLSEALAEEKKQKIKLEIDKEMLENLERELKESKKKTKKKKTKKKK